MALASQQSTTWAAPTLIPTTWISILVGVSFIRPDSERTEFFKLHWMVPHPTVCFLPRRMEAIPEFVTTRWGIRSITSKRGNGGVAQGRVYRSGQLGGDGVCAAGCASQAFA